MIARINSEGVGAALLLFDIDHFKGVNDTYGHPTGDEVLRQIARRAQDSVRSDDLVARLGGEEFAVVMPETDLAIASAVATRLRLAVATKPFVLPGASGELEVTISIGVTVANVGCEDRDQFLKRVDDALYEAKATGRNRVVARAANTLSHISLEPPPQRIPL
jgi:two-component system cell cycle response regulator